MTTHANHLTIGVIGISLLLTAAGCQNETAADSQSLGLDTCSDKPGHAGNHSLEVPTAEGTRTVHLHVPDSYEAASTAPLVLVFHGLGGSAGQIREWTQLDAESDARGFVVAYPEGLPSSNPAWNAGVCCGEHDDVAFVTALIARIRESYCIDPYRIYATGLSMGGMFSYRLACELSDWIAAIAPVSAGMLVQPLTDCQPLRPVPVLHVHGTQDPLIPYAGGPDGLGQPIEWTAVADEMALWRRRDRCSGEAEQVYGRGDATCQEWSCDEQSHVQLCTIDGGGHTWPGLAPDALPPQLGKTSQDLNANQHILDFFEQHTLR